MESGNLVVVLALTLVGTAAMFLVIARQLRGRLGMGLFAGGLALLGGVFAVPNAVDAAASLPVGLLIDGAAVGAVLLLGQGLARFMRRPGLGTARLAGAMVLFVTVAAGVRAGFGAAARPVVTELVLAALFAWLAVWAARESRGDNPLLRPPLLLLALVLALLSTLSVGQGVQMALHWPHPPSARAAAVLELLLMLGALLLGPTLLWMHTAQLARQLGELAMRDPLTRLLNENGLDELMRRHFARRQHEPMVLMLIDVDHMARVNQAHGEAAGDDVLRMIGLALESGVRADDVVARVGGEEFVAGCLGPDLSHAARLAERLRAAVAEIQTGLADGDGHRRVTVSIGLSRPFREFERYAVAWSEAEVSLQAAKDAGTNCVVHPSDS